MNPVVRCSCGTGVPEAPGYVPKGSGKYLGSSSRSLGANSHPQITFSRHQVVALSAGSFPGSPRRPDAKMAGKSSVSMYICASKHAIPARHPSRRLLLFVAGHRTWKRRVRWNPVANRRGPCSGKGVSISIAGQGVDSCVRVRFSSATHVERHSVPERPKH